MAKVKKILKGTFLSSRAYSLYWRTADMLVAGIAGLLIETLQVADVPEWSVVFAGLVLGEVTKYFNSKK